MQALYGKNHKIDFFICSCFFVMIYKMCRYVKNNEQKKEVLMHLETSIRLEYISFP